LAIKLTGEFTVTKSPDEVYEFLTDPNQFAPLLPEFQSLSIEDEKHFTIKVNVGISYIKGAANVRLELTEAERPRRAQYKGKGALAGGSATVIASFDLAPDGDGTKVNWQGEAQIFGPLASAAGGLLEPLGKKQVQKLIDGLQRALA
jgi:carbon monoxide dehydrogenase subunit G